MEYAGTLLPTWWSLQRSLHSLRAFKYWRPLLDAFKYVNKSYYLMKKCGLLVLLHSKIYMCFYFFIHYVKGQPQQSPQRIQRMTKTEEWLDWSTWNAQRHWMLAHYRCALHIVKIFRRLWYYSYWRLKKHGVWITMFPLPASEFVLGLYRKML